MAVARLGYEVDSSQAARAAVDLDRLAVASDKAGQSARRVKPGMDTAARATDTFATSNDNATRSIDRTIAAVGRLTAAESRMGTTNYDQRASDIVAYGNALDQLRAKYNPVFAASKRYEMELDELNRAHSVGAISAREYEMALDRLNAQYHQLATSANVAESAMMAYGRGTGHANMMQRQLMYQMVDVGQALASAPMMGIYALQNLGFQVAQIGQLYAGEGGLTAAVRDSTAMVGRFLAKIGPLAAVVGTIGVGFAALRSEINETSETAVSFGDVVIGAFSTIGDAIYSAMAPSIENVSSAFAAAWEWIEERAREEFNAIVTNVAQVAAQVQLFADVIAAHWGGTVTAIKNMWGLLPGAIGDLTMQVVQSVIDGLNKMLKSAADGIDFLIEQINKVPGMDLPTIGASDSIIGGPENQWAGQASGFMDSIKNNAVETGAAIADAYATYQSTMESIRGTDFFSDLTGKATENALARVEEGSKKAGGAAKKAAEDGTDAWQKFTRGVDEAAKATMEFAQDVARGFVQDFRNGLEEGKSVWRSFADAAVNALDKIATKLLDLATDQLISNLFSGSGLGGLLGGLFSGFQGTNYFPPAPVPAVGMFAKGAAFSNGSVIPFADGGIVSSPTFFPTSSGTGVMGEAGPEAIVPLRRGRGGRLGIEMAGNEGGRDESGPVQVNYSPTYNFRGTSEEMAQFRQQAAKDRREFTPKVISAVRAARAKRML